MISGVIDNEIEDPAPDEFFSPAERFPEYPFDHIASSLNTVYCAVRKLLAQSGLDIEHYGTPRGIRSANGYPPDKRWLRFAISFTIGDRESPMNNFSPNALTGRLFAPSSTTSLSPSARPGVSDLATLHSSPACGHAL